MRKALGTRRSVADLREQLTATVDPQSNLVTVTAIADDPNFAAALANAVARETASHAAASAANALPRRGDRPAPA